MAKEAGQRLGNGRLSGAIEDIPAEVLVEDIKGIFRRLFDDHKLVDVIAAEQGVYGVTAMDDADGQIDDEYDAEERRVLGPFPALQAVVDWLDPEGTDGLAKLSESIDEPMFTAEEREIISTTAAMVVVALSARLTGTTFDPNVDEQFVLNALVQSEPASEALPSDPS